MARRGTLTAIGALMLLLTGCPEETENQLALHRNLGKAFYENPTTQAEAVAEFRKALDLAPNSSREKLNYGLALLRAAQDPQGVRYLEEVQKEQPDWPHTWFNLGLHYKKAGDTQKAIAQFEQMVKLDPNEAIGHYQLGALYRQEGRNENAREHLEQAAALDPLLMAPHFQLYNLYRQIGNAELAARNMEEFQRLRARNEGAVIPEDVEWCQFAEIYDPPAEHFVAVASDVEFQDETIARVAEPQWAGLATIDASGTGRTDLLVWSAAGTQHFTQARQRLENTGLETTTGVLDAAQGDFDNDGLADLCLATEDGAQLYRNTSGRFQPVNATFPKRRFVRCIWLDYDHDNDLDAVLLGLQPALMRNQGTAGFADHTADFPFITGIPTEARKLRVDPESKSFDLAVYYRDHAPVLYRDQLGGRYTVETTNEGEPDRREVRADFDADGRIDRARIDPDGTVHRMMNDGPTGRWIRIQLQGVRSAKLAMDAQVEIKAGSHYQRKMYTGQPLHFDVSGAATVDVVRITWPNGLIQNEVRQPTNRAHSYQEQQRLSGSCPMIWTWNGREFEFITDVLGVAPLGASAGDGTYFPVDHDEYVQIPAGALKPTSGKYEIRITEELAEVSYLDQIQLIAVDHPADTELFTSEKFKAPPFPDFRLYGATRRIYPAAAQDDAGRNVLSLIARKDQRYPDQFDRTERGIAAPHWLELDFAGAAPSGQAVLLLNGWVDWPDGSTFRAASQESKNGLIVPYLQMQDATGAWKTVNAEMGMPAGKPKTISVEIRFPSASRKLRIATNLCVYWDEIFLSEITTPPEAIQTTVALDQATLRFRGFSESRIHPQRKQPDAFFYAKASPFSYWNPTPGMYTKYGDVAGLTRDIDDRMVIMGAGDELRLLFDAAALPPTKPGWRRDFLLKVDGWAKDRDPNTAHGDTVEPLPFHGMSVYPYPKTEHFPNDSVHDRYLGEYNKRPALRLLRPLQSGHRGM